MKQILKYFSVLLLTIVAIGCSSDDSNTELKELMVNVDKMTVEEGEVVKFSAVDSNNKTIDGVDYFINNVEVSNPYRFMKSGTYNVVAKKNGYNMSAPKTILVGRVLNKRLELVASRTEIVAGDNVTFQVLADGEPVNDYYIEVMGRGLLLGDTWTSLTEGTFKLYAFKGEYLNSNVVTIKVKDKPIDDNQFFSIIGEKYGIGEVQFAAHVQAEDDKNIKPYHYTDKATGKKFQVYELVSINRVRQALTSYLIGVYVADNETKFIYPSSAKPTDVFSIGGVGVVGNNATVSFSAQDIAEVNIDWIKPIAPFDPMNPDKASKGEINYDIITKDKKLQVVYKGEFKGLSFVPIKAGTKGIKKASFFSF
ncbi:hypothetical protein AS361_07825 [Myroides marinus]|uniref:hypothetical protein n=1 Tax=Myroides marinus TaxID=703342 RepID=UPI0007419B8A|nr:hypothetical protein [Myroides marinus]KUF45531.1 hypothetical protein AS361_07825 [Myroides marinus]